MEFSKQIKDELEGRIKKVEDFIAERGVGSKQLRKAKNVQRNVNLAILAGSLITLAGITLYTISRMGDHD